MTDLESQMFATAIVVANSTYVSLQRVADYFNGSCGYGCLDQPLGIQPLVLNINSINLFFENGGDSVRIGDESGAVHTLSSMLLVVGDEHYAEVTELAELLGGFYENQALSLGDTALSVEPVGYSWSNKLNCVDAIRSDNQTIRFNTPINSVDPSAAGFSHKLAADTVWHVRRSLQLNGELVMLVHGAEWPFDSYLVAEKDIEKHATELTHVRTPWQDLKQRFQQRRNTDAGLRHGNKKKLVQSACLTCDFCWSLRPLEKQLTSLFHSEIHQGQSVSFVAFMCGRWMDQHPQEMQQLIDWQLSGHYQIDWGLHSYDHPKYGEFLNAYDEAALIDDTLRNEKAMLEWGVVPSVFYRFPGLVHDDIRFSTVLSMDLLTIDCESWMALVNAESSQAFSQPIDDASIILVHANGNEPEGLPPLHQWRASNPHWSFKSLRYFLT